jgi:hypothetical protein
MNVVLDTIKNAKEIFKLEDPSEDYLLLSAGDDFHVIKSGD